MTRLLTIAAAFAFVSAVHGQSSAAAQSPPSPEGQATQQQVKPPGQTAGQAGQQQVKPPPPPTTQKPVTPPATQTPAKPAGQAGSPTSGSGRAGAVVFITDPAGKPLPDVKVTAIGPMTREGLSDRDGIVRFQGLRTGTYRLRFESKTTIIFEKEIAVKAGPLSEADATLNAAPEPPPVPAAPVKVAPNPEPPGRADIAYQPSSMNLPDWIERNFIGRTDPLKEDTIAETTGTLATVLQVRDPIKDRVHEFADEMLYVVAGDGTIQVGDRREAVKNGWLIVVPRGTTTTIERRGRNPLFLLSILSVDRR